MSAPLAILAGIAYAAGLWWIAAALARRRRLALGSRPVWLLATSGVAAGVAAAGMPPGSALPACAALIGAAVCGSVDARTGLIFDALSVTVAGSTFVAGAIENRVADGAVGALAAGIALLAVYFASGRRGIGLGDVKLGCAVALGLGLVGGAVTIGAAFVLGAAYALTKIALGRATRRDALRFGPFIAGGAALSLGARLLGWCA